MPLQLFNNNASHIDNENVSIVQRHDNQDGSYHNSILCLSNRNDTTKGYTDIRVNLIVDGDEGVTDITQRQVVYQLISFWPGREIPTREAIAQIGHNTEIALESITPGAEANRYFILRTFVPRAMPVSYDTEASLRVSAIEIAD